MTIGFAQEKNPIRTFDSAGIQVAVVGALQVDRHWGLLYLTWEENPAFSF